MTSERLVERWARQNAEREDWEAANPELAAAWNEANEVQEQLRQAEHIKRFAAEAQRHYLATMADRLVKMGVPLRLAEAIQAEESLPVEERRHATSRAMQSAAEFVDRKRAFILMFGGVGSGKTCAACWTLLRARAASSFDSRSYREVPVAGDLDSDKGRFIRASEASRISRFDDGGSWNALLRTRYLVVDDLGVETVTDFWSERINELLDVRWGNRLPTAMTTNLNPEEFKRRYGERITSRVRDDGVICGCGSDDLRGKP